MVVKEDSYHIVKFLVKPFSIKHEFEGAGESPDFEDAIRIINPIASCGEGSTQHTTWDMIEGRHEPQPASGRILYTYDVIWLESDLTFADRWNDSLGTNFHSSNRTHRASVSRSHMNFLVVSVMVVVIVLRNLRREVGRYSRVLDNDKTDAEESDMVGWELVHSDVFRTPPMSMLLSVACGTGAQLLFTAVTVIMLAALGFMSYAHRGKLVTMEIMLFILFGFVNGYITARLCSAFKRQWVDAVKLSATGFPGLCFAFLLCERYIGWVNSSTYRFPFHALLLMLLLWAVLSVPLIFLGAYCANNRGPIEFPYDVNDTPRPIDRQPWYKRFWFTAALGGVLPFVSVFNELVSSLCSLWDEWYYTVFGMLFFVTIFVVVTCAQISILLTFWQLRSGNHQWWWRSFCNTGATGIYVFFCSFIYFNRLVEANSLTNCTIYFGYMGLVSLGVFLMTGSVGLMSSLWFNKLLFSNLRRRKDANEAGSYLQLVETCSVDRTQSNLDQPAEAPVQPGN